MGLESTNTRMSALARSEMTYGVYRSPEETAEALDAVTREDVLALAREVLDFDQASFAAVGNVSPAADYLTRLELA